MRPLTRNRWAFGAFAIILVGFCVPVAVIFIANEKKAKALGQIPEKTQSRPWFEAFKYYLVEFDGTYRMRFPMHQGEGYMLWHRLCLEIVACY